MSTPSLNRPIQRTSLVDSVYETLLEAIVSGGLPPGTILNSVELSGRLDVSRTPVKEAIKLLTHDGMVEQVNNHKARVTRFSGAEITEIYDVRKQLEAAAAEKAAKRIDDDTLAGLRREARQLLRSRADVDWSERVMEYDIRFHDTLAAACGNARLKREIARYRLLVRGFCRMTGREEILFQALKEHVEILDALEARSGARARRAMASHIDARLQAVLDDTSRHEV